MKHTKSMIIRETAEANELYLFTVNDSNLYNYMLKPVLASLRKKYIKGVYDSARAIDSYYYVATEAAKRYGKLYGNNNGLRIFDVTARYTAAAEMEKRYLEDIQEG